MKIVPFIQKHRIFLISACFISLAAAFIIAARQPTTYEVYTYAKGKYVKSLLMDKSIVASLPSRSIFVELLEKQSGGKQCDIYRVSSTSSRDILTARRTFVKWLNNFNDYIPRWITVDYIRQSVKKPDRFKYFLITLFLGMFSSIALIMAWERRREFFWEDTPDE